MRGRALQRLKRSSSGVERPETRVPAHTNEPGRGDPDDRVALAVHVEHGAERGFRGAESLSPVCVADDDGPVAAGRAIFAVEEEATALRRVPENREVMRRHGFAAHAL